ncbi:MAG TPA: hydroxylamine reductase, partial [Treponemataceae bacterium]|nr:hydroxylamine reductase [Treponemataceae bacterium]
MSMFCFQCEQTAGGKACTVAGACGKKESTANLQDGLTGKLIALSRAVKDKGRSAKTDELVLDALFTAITNVSFDDAQISALAARIDTAVADLGGYGSYPEMDLNELWQAGDEDTRSLKSLLLFGMRGMAAYAHHAAAL